MTQPDYTLARLGWSAQFLRQLDIDEIGRVIPARVVMVHRDRIDTLSEAGAVTLVLPSILSAGDVAVGDWVIFEPDTHRVLRVLERSSILSRRAAGSAAETQLIAANIDTLFITSALNDDFNPARIERYLALAHTAGVQPVMVLTRADLCPDTDVFLDDLRAIARDMPAFTLDARDADAVRTALGAWCGPGQTVAFVGSSGVGKSTLVSALTGKDLLTQGIREDDAKGRHTTTARALYELEGGGWVVDTPGMRELQLSEAGDGIDEVFADITDLVTQCRFSDCQHETEPGCAVRAAIEAGDLDEARLMRWQKLKREDQYNSETIAEARARYRKFGKMVKGAKKRKGR